jgi:hypothetical protein
VREGGIRREYNELDTLWFMAGSLFQVFLYHPYIFIFLLETTIITVLYFRIDCCYAAIPF